MSLKLKPSFIPGDKTQESPSTASLISHLALERHIEGGYFAEIDRNPLIIPNPFLAPTSSSPSKGPSDNATTFTATTPFSGDNNHRNASTSIFYLLTPVTPQGHFHRNKGRTVHTLIQGRGVYVLIHADEDGEKKRVESFVVGHAVEKGEKSVWIVEGGKYKASFLLGGGGCGGEGEDKLLISEVCLFSFFVFSLL
jgi:predicted cupin superfamily sugar epimerase